MLFSSICWYDENVITTPIELELRKLGLTEKEVRVYLAGLELGPSSVQKIAEIAKITRPTAYEIIRKLKEKGLFAETSQNKKRHFSAQSPEKILRILRVQKKEIEERERELIRVISALEAKYSRGKDEIKIFKEKEGLKALEEILSFTSTPEIFILNPKGIKAKKIILQKIEKRLGKINSKEVNTDIKGTLIIFDKAIFLPSQKKEGYLIQNQAIVGLLKSLFLALWAKAKK